ncbi:MAG TPA: diaminopimelate decarboxylase [Vicinamibacterales bacterium]|nr:diaminopimelate decarboxylase [Vicinamibacterales bacterium]
MSSPSSVTAASGLTVDGVALAQIAAGVGTPCYIYSAASIRDAYTRLDSAFADYPHAIHYALKANSTLGIVRLVKSLGSSVDANSMGEVDVALRCGFHPSQIMFTGVGKSAAELSRAIGLGLKAINVESPGELDRLDALAREQRTVARVALRVNPDIDARSHPHISTGLKTNKFGVPIDAAPEIFREIQRRSGLEAVGVHSHIGSQITTLDPLLRAATAAVELAASLRASGVPLRHVDFGGGVGISYDGTPAIDSAEYSRGIVAIVKPTGLTALLEPGRVLIGPAGTLLTRVVDVKHFAGARQFIVLDAGMTELMRPALYGAFHRIEPVQPREGARITADIVGPVCESTDTFARDRELAPVDVGDLMVVRDVGAYGAVMGSTYLRRPLPPEILVDAGAWRVIRRRQTLDDMLRLEDQ